MLGCPLFFPHSPGNTTRQDARQLMAVNCIQQRHRTAHQQNQGDHGTSDQDERAEKDRVGTDCKTQQAEQETHPLTSLRSHISPTQFWTLPASLMVVVQAQTKHSCPARVVFVHCPCPEQSFVASAQTSEELKQDEGAVMGRSEGVASTA